MSGRAPKGHFDGTRFRNPGLPPRRFGPILWWMLTRRKARWPDRIPNPGYPPPGPVPAGHAAVTFIGHSTTLIRFGLPGGAMFTVLTDPVFSERCSPVTWLGPRRVRDPGIALDALPRIDAVLVSHNHYDHMDLRSLRELQARHAPQVVTTLGNARTLAAAGVPGATELDWWDHVALGPLRITATPAQHFSSRGPFDRDQTLWAGFMLDADGGRVLFAGDSGAGPHWGAIRDRLGPPDVALLPIGAYLPRRIMQPVHMDPAEAVQARADLGAPHAIGLHYGTWQLTDEGVDAPLHGLAAARDRAGIGRDAFDALGFGETRVMALAAREPLSR